MVEQNLSLSLNQNEVDCGVNNNTKNKFKFQYLFIIYILMGFLMGQAEVLTGLFPFALIYWVLFIGFHRFLFIFITLSTGLGLIWGGNWQNLTYLLAGFTGLIIFRLKKKPDADGYLSLLISISFLVISCTLNYINDSLLYQYLIKIGESLLLFLTLIIVREGGRKFFLKHTINRTVRITLLLVSIGFLIGLSQQQGISQSIINILTLVLIIGTANHREQPVGVLLAAVYGLALVSTGVIPVITMTKYIIFGLVAWFFNGRGKGSVIISLGLALLIYSGLSPSNYYLQLSTIEAVSAGLIYLLLPQSVWQTKLFSASAGRNGLTRVQLEKNYSGNYKQQFTELSRVFAELSTTFEEVLPGELAEEMKRVDDFVFLFKNRNCSRCSRRNLCWRKEKNNTYQRITALLKAGEKRGSLDENLVAQYMGEQCPYYQQILSGVRSSFEIYQVNSYWRNRLIDKQKIVAEQLAGISNLINQFSLNSRSILNPGQMGEEIIRKLNSVELGVSKVELNPDFNFKIEMEPCASNQPCEEQIIDFLNCEFKPDFRILERKCGNKLKDEPCIITYGPRGDYILEVASLQRSIHNVCGDTFLYKMLNNGNDLIVLSDGMGIGENAARESRAAVKLFESIIAAGFEQDLAIRTINSALFLRNQEERFTTLDIAFFNTFTGEIIFKKIGAMSSFIKRGWEVEEIKSASPPAGILEEIEITSYQIKLRNNDLIIMITDGILDARPEIKGKEEWFKQLLQNSSFDTAKALADYILEMVSGGNGQVCDDMSVIVIRVEEINRSGRRFIV